MKYQIGPEPELLKEIGQVMVNYSQCESSIHGIFQTVMGLDEGQMYLLVSKANLNTEKMVAVIRSEIHQVRPTLLQQSVLDGLTLFTTSTPMRNAVAHWQWAVTTGLVGTAINSLKAKPNQDPDVRHYTLKDLQLISWQIAKATFLLMDASVLMTTATRSALAGESWRQLPYELAANIDRRNQLIEIAIQNIRQRIDEYEGEHFSSEPPPSSDIDHL